MIEQYSSLPRCMDRLRRKVESEDPLNPAVSSGIVVKADQLSHSSGRFQRTWHAPPGGIYMAMLWADTLIPAFSRLIPFAVGLACCQTARQNKIDATVKWVNDIMVNNKKTGGILCETIYSPAGGQYHLIGIGMNINLQQFHSEIQDIATSFSMVSNREFKIDTVFLQLMSQLQWYLGLLHFSEEIFLMNREEKTTTPPLMTEWRQHCDSVGKKVVYGYDVQRKPLYEAVVKGINENGSIIMELADGQQVIENSGEIIYI